MISKKSKYLLVFTVIIAIIITATVFISNQENFSKNITNSALTETTFTPDNSTVNTYTPSENVHTFEPVSDTGLETTEPVNPEASFKPENIKASEISVSGVKLIWEGQTSKYRINISEDGVNYNLYNDVDGNEITINNLKSGTKYWVNIYCINNDGTVSGNYSSITFETEAIKPPANLKVSDIHETGAHLNWSGNGEMYKIEISEDGSTFNHLAWANDNAYNISKLKPDKKYWIRVYSTDTGKNVTDGFVSIDFSTKKINPITSLNASYITDRGAIVKWSGGTGKYQIKISTDGTTFSNYKSYTDKNSESIIKLKSGTKYWVRIYNLDGNKSLTDSYSTVQFTTQKSTLEKKNSNYKTYISSASVEDYVRVDILDDGTIKIKGLTISKDRYVSLAIMNNNFKDVYNSSAQIESDKTYSLSVKTTLPDGKYEIYLFFGENEYGTFISKYKINIYIDKGNTFFKTSPIYEHNYKFFTENSYITESYITSSLSSKNQKRIKELAESITKGISNDYDKVKAICTWVSDNIYYDWDGYIKGKYGKNDAISVLDSKKSVCAGYANLTAELIKAINIPCKVVSGFALGAGTSGDWETSNHSRSNHAWNEAYVDGRWIIIDTTWNSRNKYEDGKFVYGGYNYNYFDPYLEIFSDDHKILAYE